MFKCFASLDPHSWGIIIGVVIFYVWMIGGHAVFKQFSRGWYWVGILGILGILNFVIWAIVCTIAIDEVKDVKVEITQCEFCHKKHYKIIKE